MTERKKISIVMTTYNGEKYVQEQLDSLLAQSMSADEILIFDDCSRDSTVETIKKYIKVHSNNGIELRVNSANCGWKKNFMQAISKATGDYIFLSDQDDIWKRDKIEKCVHVLDSMPDALLVATNYEVLNERGGAIQEELDSRRMKNDETIENVIVSPHFADVGHPGCTYGFRKELFQECSSLWSPELAHDKLLWVYAMMIGKLYILNYKSIQFRRHSNNASGRINITTTKEQRINSIVGEIHSINKILNAVRNEITDEAYKIVKQYIEYQELRKELIQNRSIRVLIKLCLEYNSFFFSFKSFCKDVYIAYFK